MCTGPRGATLFAPQPWLEKLVQVGAITAMLGVLLNLILGLSRVYLAFGRRNDLPKAFAKLDAQFHVSMTSLVCIDAHALAYLKRCM